MKVTFVIPSDDGCINPLNDLAQCRLLPPVGLARMAGHAGKLGATDLVDERRSDARHITDADIAVIFINSYNRTRAYALANDYHARGTYVVFTGPVLAKSPEQACDHADCLFIGDGNEIFPVFLTDYLAGKMRRLYAPNLNPRSFRPSFVTAQGQELRIANM